MGNSVHIVDVRQDVTCGYFVSLCAQRVEFEEDYRIASVTDYVADCACCTNTCKSCAILRALNADFYNY